MRNFLSRFRETELLFAYTKEAVASTQVIKRRYSRITMKHLLGTLVLAAIALTPTAGLLVSNNQIAVAANEGPPTSGEEAYQYWVLARGQGSNDDGNWLWGVIGGYPGAFCPRIMPGNLGMYGGASTTMRDNSILTTAAPMSALALDGEKILNSNSTNMIKLAQLINKPLDEIDIYNYELTAYEKYGVFSPIYENWTPVITKSNAGGGVFVWPEPIRDDRTGVATSRDSSSMYGVAIAPTAERMYWSNEEYAHELRSSGYGQNALRSYMQADVGIHTGTLGYMGTPVWTNCLTFFGDIGTHLANFLSLLPKMLTNVAIGFYSLGAGMNASAEGSFAKGLVDSISNMITERGGLRDALFLPFLLPIIVLGAGYLIYVGLIKRRTTATLSSLMWMVLAVAFGTAILANPAAVATAMDGVVATGQKVISGTVTTSNNNHDMCSLQEDSLDASIRETKCTIWYTTVYVPWLHGQFGGTPGTTELISSYVPAMDNYTQLPNNTPFPWLYTGNPDVNTPKELPQANGGLLGGDLVPEFAIQMKDLIDVVGVYPPVENDSTTLFNVDPMNILSGDKGHVIYYGPGRIVTPSDWGQFMLDRQGTLQSPEIGLVAYAQLAGYEGSPLNNDWAGGNTMARIWGFMGQTLMALGVSLTVLILSLFLVFYQFQVLGLILMSPFVFLLGAFPKFGERLVKRYGELMVGLVAKRLIITLVLAVFLVLLQLMMPLLLHAIILNGVLMIILGVVVLRMRKQITTGVVESINFGGDKRMGIFGSKAIAGTAGAAAGAGAGAAAGAIIGSIVPGVGTAIGAGAGALAGAATGKKKGDGSVDKGTNTQSDYENKTEVLDKAASVGMAGATGGTSAAASAAASALGGVAGPAIHKQPAQESPQSSSDKETVKEEKTAEKQGDAVGGKTAESVVKDAKQAAYSSRKAAEASRDTVKSANSNNGNIPNIFPRNFNQGGAQNAPSADDNGTPNPFSPKE